MQVTNIVLQVSSYKLQGTEYSEKVGAVLNLYLKVKITLISKSL
jgi:hypothetical protein